MWSGRLSQQLLLFLFLFVIGRQWLFVWSGQSKRIEKEEMNGLVKECRPGRNQPFFQKDFRPAAFSFLRVHSLQGLWARSAFLFCLGLARKSTTLWKGQVKRKTKSLSTGWMRSIRFTESSSQWSLRVFTHKLVSTPHKKKERQRRGHYVCVNSVATVCGRIQRSALRRMVIDSPMTAGAHKLVTTSFLFLVVPAHKSLWWRGNKKKKTASRKVVTFP